MEELHACQPPMEPRLVSAPTEWQCSECASWWDIEPGVAPQVAPAYDFLAHQGVVPAKWIPRQGA